MSASAAPATATMTAAQAAELAVIERSGFIESRHIGSAVVLDPDGAVYASVGTPEAPVLTRSCLKPVQAVAMMDAGVPLAGEAAVLATASHRSEAGHVRVVEAMLADAGLDETALQCPAVAPADPDFRYLTRAEGRQSSRVFFNCSGKHAAFLAACVRNGWDPAAYLAPDSPVQQAVAEAVEQYCGAPSDFFGTDGCGAPVHAMPLTRLARGIGQIAAGASEPARLLTEAVVEHPWAIDGHGRPNAVAIERLQVLAKFGAEGVMVMGTRDGWAVAVKCLDGSNRITSMVALELLAHAGAVDAEAALPVISDLAPQITGGIDEYGAPAVVGQVRAGAGLYDAMHGREQS